MGQIQKLIEQHVTLDNNFVKSIQIENESDNEVIVPNGYSIRFINCQIKELTARNSAIHIFCTNIETATLSDCLVSIDGGTINKLLKSTGSRINIKKLPKALSPEDKEVPATIKGSLDFVNTESFWNEVTWSDSGSGTTIVNSRIEFSNCKVNNQKKLEVTGTEWYNILGTYSFEEDVTIKQLEPVQGATDPEIAMDYNVNNTTSVSVNKIRGSAGVGAGCIVHFKSCESIQGAFDVTGSEVNFYDIENLKSKKELVKYKDNCSGFFSSCKINAEKACVDFKGTGNLYFTNCELTSKDTAIIVKGPGANCTVSSGKITSDKDCLSIDSATLDIYGIEKMESKKNCITLLNATSMLFGCKELKAEENTFDLTQGSVLDSDNTKKLTGKIIFKGKDSSFIVRGDTELDAKEKEISGSGVFVSNP
jgi:hypothetical protein